MLKSLLSGHEVQLSEGAFGPLSQQILRLYTEVKLIQREQAEDLDNIPIVSFTMKSAFRGESESMNNFHSFFFLHRHCRIPLKRNLHFVFVVKPLMQLVSVGLNSYGECRISFLYAKINR